MVHCNTKYLPGGERKRGKERREEKGGAERYRREERGGKREEGRKVDELFVQVQRNDGDQTTYKIITIILHYYRRYY